MRTANAGLPAPFGRAGVGGLLSGRGLPVLLAARLGVVAVVAYWISVYGRFGGKEVTGWAVIRAGTGGHVAVVGGVAPAGMPLVRPQWPIPRPSDPIPVLR